MKKNLILVLALLSFLVLNTKIAFAENNFSKALRTCENYTKSGSIPFNGENFDLLITLNKTLKGQCIYKEKIIQPVGYELLTCTFSKDHLPFLADSMEKYNQTFKKEIAKNDIFEAKMTTNGVVFKKYLSNPELCKITSKKY